jgi:hypothetical protein
LSHGKIKRFHDHNKTSRGIIAGKASPYIHHTDKGNPASPHEKTEALHLHWKRKISIRTREKEVQLHYAHHVRKGNSASGGKENPCVTMREKGAPYPPTT